MYRIRLHLLCFLLFFGSILSGCATTKYGGWQTQEYASKGWMAVANNQTKDHSGFRLLQDAIHNVRGKHYILDPFFREKGLPDWVFSPDPSKIYLAYLRSGIIFEDSVHSSHPPKEIHYSEFQNLPDHLTQKFRNEAENAVISAINVEKKNSTISSAVSPKPQYSSYIDLGLMSVVNNDPSILFSAVLPKEILYTKPLSLYQEFRENNVKPVAHAQKSLPQAAVEVTSAEKKESSEIPDISHKQQISPSTLKASTERRVALVIGNAGYKYTSPLRNPLNDARDMVKVLRDLNFDTIEVTNGSKRQIIDAIDTFGERLQHAQVGLFYFAGHGVQYHGRNYLIPVEAKITHATDLEHDSVDVARVLGRMDHASTALNIVILDACRNNPYRNLIGFRGDSDRGLAQISGVRSSLIAYATQPDNVAEDGTGLNGTYTKHLLEYLKRPGLSLPDLFSQVGRSVSQETNGKQQPWVSFSSLPHFCFSGCDPIW